MMLILVRSTLLDRFAGESFAEIWMIFQKTWFLISFEVFFSNLRKLLMLCGWFRKSNGFFGVLIIVFTGFLADVFEWAKQFLMLDNFWNLGFQRFSFFGERCSNLNGAKHSPWRICRGELRWDLSDFSEEVISDKFRGHFLKSERTFDALWLI